MILIRTILPAKNDISHSSKLISLVFQQAGFKGDAERVSEDENNSKKSTIVEFLG